MEIKILERKERWCFHRERQIVDYMKFEITGLDEVICKYIVKNIDYLRDHTFSGFWNASYENGILFLSSDCDLTERLKKTLLSYKDIAYKNKNYD